MSFRGRVIRRRPYACYITPMSAQQESVEFVRYCNMFNAVPYVGFSGSPATMLPKLARYGWFTAFPYPSIYSDTLAAKWAVTEQVWLRVPSDSYHFSAYMQKADDAGSGFAALVVIDKSNPSSPVIKMEKIWGALPGSAAYDMVEMFQPDVSSNPYGVRFSTICEGSNTFYSVTTGALAKTDEVFVAMAFTQPELIQNAYGTLTGALLPAAYLQSLKL